MRFLKHVTLVWIVQVMAAATASAQISPGTLARVHSALNGPGHCTECHDAAENPPRFKCLDCHRDIRERLAAKRGMHPSLVGADTTGRTCVACHSDHNGVNFEIIHWDTPVEKFDHRRTGWPLAGKHASLACRECHQPAHIPAAARETLTGKDLTRTYLGLPRDCAGCHADIHRGQFKPECSSCHDTVNWKKAGGFDHSKADFSPVGAHEKVPCAKCHPTVQDQKPYIKYKGIPFKDCAPCHNDPHKGAFRTACTSCHSSTSTWKPVKTSGIFDHSTTRYPLEGKHASVPCASCHRQGDFKQPLPFSRCTDCHKSDPHHGQFAASPSRGECSACHTVSSFKASTFGVGQHAATRFPLRERHVEVPCAKCHVSGADGIVFKMADFSCVRCHADIHAGQFHGAPYENRCESCHNERSFKPSAFTVERHAAGRFPLTGGHVGVACAKCHPGATKAGATQAAKFVFPDRSCTVCHDNPHTGQFASRMSVLLANGNAAGCQACHSTKTWKELQGFDHSTTGFPLEGAHKAVLCDQCHKSEKPAMGVRGIRYDSAPKTCAGCHADVHGGQLASGAETTDCARCHRISKWKPSSFDHDTQSTFHLEGAHRTVPCDQCHQTGTMANGARGVIYKPTARLCSACHRDAHAGQFSDGSRPPECPTCHTVSGWKPSTFNHDIQSAYKLEGAHRTIACVRCHRNTREVEGRMVVIYKPTPRECAACHK